MLRTYQVIYIGLELVIALLAVAGNILVCWSVCLNSNLQSITNFFVVSLAVADIAVGLLAIPFAITISVGFCAEFHGCLFIACFVLVLTQSSIFSLLAIAVDRYIAIKNPLRYNSLVTGQRAKGIIAFCWVLSVAIGLTPMFGWNTGWNSTITTSENKRCSEGMTECFFEKVVTLHYMVYFNFFGCVLVPLFLMLVIYIHIFMAARRQLRLMTLKVSQTPAPGQRAPTPSSSRSFLQREVRAAKSLAIIVGLFALCWLPLHIINCYNHLCQNCERPHILVMNIAIILSHANSAVNPFIYAYRIREFRQTFQKIWWQHIMRQRDSCRVGPGDTNSREIRSHSIRRTSQTSKDDSSGGTVVNSFVLEVTPDQAGQNAARELPWQWTSYSHVDSSCCITNGHQGKGGPSAEQEEPYIIDSAERSDAETSRASNAGELKHTGSCISFVNVPTFSQKHTDCSAGTADVS
ncbi:adenosine receptor A2b [Oryzias melastigma]|uniref:adenosine receptor A2b n=1 Tax=Oryzias melastigma TaxID=30732 RepID=UPI000CF7C2DD|nr:adenosine receptor A2b [Oryzias melastigma]XP_024154417.1 adenosine receptor A2b [Oryzias melastigma]